MERITLKVKGCKLPTLDFECGCKCWPETIGKRLIFVRKGITIKNKSIYLVTNAERNYNLACVRGINYYQYEI